MGDVRPPVTTKLLSGEDFGAPVDDRWFEDYAVGSVYEYGYASVSAEEIVEFASRFDPQFIHVDPVWAANGPFGGLIASGWHTGSLLMRLFADHYLSWVASLSSPGLDELRWPAPVRPGSRLRLRVTTVEARRSRSKPDRGIVVSSCEMLDDTDTVVLSVRATNLIAARGA